VVAVVGEEVVGCALKMVRGFFHDGFEFGVGAEDVALEDFLAECSTWGLTAGTALYSVDRSVAGANVLLNQTYGV
jgi:hypothetical protein